MPTVPRLCGHTRANGLACRSAALRNRPYCYFHNQLRRRPKRLNLAMFEDAESVQIAIFDVARSIASHQISPRDAGLMLYALQTAAINLRACKFQPHELSYDRALARYERGLAAQHAAQAECAAEPEEEKKEVEIRENPRESAANEVAVASSVSLCLCGEKDLPAQDSSALSACNPGCRSHLDVTCNAPPGPPLF